MWSPAAYFLGVAQSAALVVLLLTWPAVPRGVRAPACLFRAPDPTGTPAPTANATQRARAWATAAADLESRGGGVYPSAGD